MSVTTRSTIEALERDWCDALIRRDLDRLGELVHPDFTLIGMRSTGPFLLKRDEWLDAIQRRDVVQIDLDISDSSAVGDVMVGTVFAKWRLKYLGKIIEDCVVLTDVWVCVDGRWQVIRRHSTPSPPGGCAKA